MLDSTLLKLVSHVRLFLEFTSTDMLYPTHDSH